MGMIRAISSTMRQKMKKTLLKKRIIVTGAVYSWRVSREVPMEEGVR